MPARPFCKQVPEERPPQDNVEAQNLIAGNTREQEEVRDHAEAIRNVKAEPPERPGEETTGGGRRCSNRQVLQCGFFSTD